MGKSSNNLTHGPFEEVLIQVEGQLRISLAKSRAETGHSGEKGTKLEVDVRKVLRKYLPSDLKVGHGHVIDSHGAVSRQTDVIIANGDHPFTYPDEESGGYMIEGVSAVGEVKSKLTMGTLADCIRKGTQYKQLRHLVRSTDHVTNMSEYMPQRNVMPPFFVVAFDSNVKFSRLLERLEAADPPLPENASYSAERPHSPIDAVCILGKGVLWNLKVGDGPIPIRRREDGSRAQGWISFKTQAPLAFTLGWLHLSMPRIDRSHSIFAPYMDKRVRHGDLMSSESGFEMPETEIIDSAGQWRSAPPEA